MNKTLSASLRTTAALSTAALALGLAAPAYAEGMTFKDPMDTFHGSDLRKVVVHNTDNNLFVRTHHYGLRRDFRTGSAGSVYIDTDRSDKGPEYVFTGAFFQGSDYQLLHTEGFGAKNWGRRVTKGFHSMKVDYDKELVRFRMTRAALGHPGKVRIAVRVVGTRTDGTSKGLVDWLGKPRSFTPWIAKG